jgi:ketosteroid isomerase-like protein
MSTETNKAAVQLNESTISISDSETLRDLIERQWIEFDLARDWDNWLATADPDVVYMPADEPSLRGHAELRAWMKHFPQILKATHSVVDVDGSANHAVVRCTHEIAIELAGKRVENSGKFLCYFRKNASGKWLLKWVCVNWDRPMASVMA